VVVRTGANVSQGEPPIVSDFDRQEYDRYVRAADEQVDDARTLAAHGSYNSAVVHL
jgi:hypothetical protein